MSYAGNTPSNLTVLRLEARKSFSLTLAIKDERERPVDITGCTFEFVMKRQPLQRTGSSDDDNLVVNSAGVITDAAEGGARFNLQASDLSAAQGSEYPFAIVMRTSEGYSAVIVKGIVDLQENTEYESVLFDFDVDEVQPEQGIEVLLRDMVTIEVRVGGMLPPGMNYMTDQEKADLAELVDKWMDVVLGTAAFKNVEFFARAEQGVPEGGLKGRVLKKRTNTSFDMEWMPEQGSGGGADIEITDHDIYTLMVITQNENGLDGEAVDPSEVPWGYVVMSLGNGSWDWRPVELTADDIDDGVTHVTMTVQERTKLNSVAAGATVQVSADWNATSGVAQILNKPTLGTAASQPSSAFATAGHTHRVINLDGIDRGTVAPSGGVDGDIYLWIKD